LSWIAIAITPALIRQLAADAAAAAAKYFRQLSGWPD